MNTAAVITAACFTALSVAFLVFLFITKNPLLSGKFRNYDRAGAAVYISGTLVLLFLACVLKDLPTSFIVIAEVMIMTVFIVTYILIANLSRTLAAVTSRNAQQPEQEEKTDE